MSKSQTVRGRIEKVVVEVGVGMRECHGKPIYLRIVFLVTLISVAMFLWLLCDDYNQNKKVESEYSR